MEKERLHDWEHSLDISVQVPMTDGLPMDVPRGTFHKQLTDNDGYRLWVRLQIVGGVVGGRWAYWVNKAESTAVADSIFNGDASHFIGMLGIPYTGFIPGVEVLSWVLVEPRLSPPPEIRIYEEKPRERYEKSREVYNVETGESFPLYPRRDGVGEDR